MGLPGRLLYLRLHLRPWAGHQAARPSSLLRIQNTISRFSTDACESEVVGSSFGAADEPNSAFASHRYRRGLSY